MRNFPVCAFLACLLAACGGGGDAPPAASVPQVAFASVLAPSAQALPAATTTTRTALRIYQAFYGAAPGNAELATYALQVTGNGAALASRFAADFTGTADGPLATLVLENLSVTSNSVDITSYFLLQVAVSEIFRAYGPSARGQIVANLVGLLVNLEADRVYGSAARTYNAQVAANETYSSNPANTTSTRRTGATGTTGGTASTYQSAFNACFDGTPALYSTAYCDAYANAIVAGSTAAAANLAGATAANSNVGNIGTGQAVSATGTPRTGTSTSTTTSTSTSSTSSGGLATYPAVWISASFPFSGQATSYRSIVDNATGSHCPPNTLLLENRTARYKSLFSNSESAFVFFNNCTAPMELLVCAFAGSGGNTSELPVCNVDPVTTPMSRLRSISMAGAGRGTQSATWVDNRGSISVNIFYCGVGATFSAGAVRGKNPTECLKF
jgi:hypothetical protein